MRKQFLVFPLLVLGIVGVYAFRGLSIDGSSAPSVLIGQEAPAIELGAVPGYPGPFGQEAFGGEVTLVNIWGSWCIYCLYEHPVLLEMQSEGVLIYGIAWNDAPDDAAAWLERHGSPFAAVGLDPEGYAVAQFGVTGAPETFVIDKEGVVRFRYVGPISERDWRRVIKPLIADLENESASS
ncbi:DsbE family thiol:disulfide interchange protein [Parvularcula maris]|uniref:DsbE family thiol:disulfide interchange protein n=1 Tax=Parvularcula maris TaxID=2965077 RepID=A0A9X2RHY5_9PROT|nr:DsbE family thiol:disulfide interchange protein [Parvularcula maris]MCQ8184396.1 DsbE family thiol:disulfide interchange protein [Parvularcula maris]